MNSYYQPWNIKKLFLLKETVSYKSWQILEQDIVSQIFKSSFINPQLSYVNTCEVTLKH